MLQFFEALLHAIDSLGYGLVIARTDGSIVFANSSFAVLTGYTNEELLSLPTAAALVTVEENEILGERFLRLVANPESSEYYESSLKAKDGSLVDVEASMKTIEIDNEIQVLSIMRDIRDRRLAEAQLQHSYDLLRKTDDQRRQLLNRLIRAQEEERRKIASDVHDDSIQVMIAASLRLQMIGQVLDDPKHVEAIEQIDGAVSSATSRLRRLIFELNPPALSRHGLAAAVGQYLDELAKGTTIRFQFHDNLDAEPHYEARVVLYRVAQEALSNVRKHSQASSVQIRLANKEDGVQVNIRDDGVGFLLEKKQELVPGHIGLASMRERVELSGGRLRVDSVPGKGTEVEAWVPLGTENEHE